MLRFCRWSCLRTEYLCKQNLIRNQAPEQIDNEIWNIVVRCENCNQGYKGSAALFAVFTNAESNRFILVNGCPFGTILDK